LRGDAESLQLKKTASREASVVGLCQGINLAVQRYEGSTIKYICIPARDGSFVTARGYVLLSVRPAVSSAEMRRGNICITVVYDTAMGLNYSTRSSRETPRDFQDVKNKFLFFISSKKSI